jgi:hypothetical protein
MNTRLHITYRLEFTVDEFRLVSKALRGALDVAERPVALALQERMLRDKHEFLRQQLESSQKAIDNIDAAAREDAARDTAARHAATRDERFLQPVDAIEKVCDHEWCPYGPYLDVCSRCGAELRTARFS